MLPLDFHEILIKGSALIQGTVVQFLKSNNFSRRLHICFLSIFAVWGFLGS